MIALRNLDLIILAVAFVVFLVAGLPIGATDPKQVVGIATGSMIGRGWLMALILVSVGLLTEDEVGLTAAVLTVVLFTAWFTTKMILRPFEPGSSGPGEVTTP